MMARPQQGCEDLSMLLLMVIMLMVGTVTWACRCEDLGLLAEPPKEAAPTPNRLHPVPPLIQTRGCSQPEGLVRGACCVHSISSWQ